MPIDGLNLRNYLNRDADITLDIFQRAIREVARNDYTPVQIEAWAGGIERMTWARHLEQQATWLAILDNLPVGFAKPHRSRASRYALREF